MKRYKKALLDKEMEIVEHDSQLERNFVKYKAKYKESCDFKMQQDLAKLNKLFDEEKQDLQSEIGEMRIKVQYFDQLQTKSTINFFFERWAFVAKIKSLQMKEDSPRQQSEMAVKAERSFFQRELQKLQEGSGAGYDQLKQDLRLCRQENNELCEKMSSLEYEIFTLKSEKEELMGKMQEMRVRSEGLEAQLVVAAKE